MNHTAGFEEQMMDLRYYRPEREVSLFTVMSTNRPKQVFKPGKICAYSNRGAALAALIVEQLSHQSYADYVKENILKPLDMRNTSLGPFLGDVTRVDDFKATGYSYGGFGSLTEPPMHLRMCPTGSMNGSESGLSHGFWQYVGSDKTFGHEGGAYGFKTQFWVQPD